MRPKAIAISGTAALVVAVGAFVAIRETAGSSATLSVAQVHAAAAKLGDHGPACPLRFDRAAAAKSAGADTAFVPATDPQDIAYGQVPEGSEADSPAVRFGMSSVGCDFTTTLHGASVEVHIQVFAAAKGSVLNAIAPQLQYDAELPHGALIGVISQKLAIGQVRTLKGDAAAGVGRFDPAGSGEVVVEVAQVLSGQDKAAPIDVQALTEKLLDQIKL